MSNATSHSARYNLLILLGQLNLYPLWAFHQSGATTFRPISQHHPDFKLYKAKHTK